MEIFYAENTGGDRLDLGPAESAHCVRVLRHRAGDRITVVDGCGTKYDCILTDDDPRGASARILSREEGWNAHPYFLRMAVCPTKNNDRYEWFAEKATEIGVDEICPVIGERSERRVLGTGRLEKIVLSAMKQSLKARLPLVREPVSVSDFIRSLPGGALFREASARTGSQSDRLPEEEGPLQVRLICWCFEGETVRRSVREVLARVPKGSEITILIGPEGDFSPEEAALAVAEGFIPVHLGSSRLRTETAAVVAATACYLHFID